MREARLRFGIRPHGWNRGSDAVCGHRPMGGPGGGARLRLRACRGPAALARAAGVRVDDVRGDGLPRNVRGAHEVHAALAPRLQRAVPPPGVDRQGVRLSRRRVAGAHRPRGRGRGGMPTSSRRSASRANGGGRYLEESVEVIRRLWTENHVDHDGPCFSFRDVSVEPKPVQQPHPPIWFGSIGPEAHEFNPLVKPGPRPHRPARGRLGAAHLFHAREGDDRSGPSRPGVAAHRGGNAGGGPGPRGASRSSTRTGAT